jgi:DNA polymerase III subunit beta
MKVAVERSELLRGLSHVHRVVEKRNTIPILSNIYISAENGTLRLKATDLDIEVTETLKADVSVEGITTIPAHLAFEIVRKMPDGAQISLETLEDKGTLALKAGRSRFALQTIPEHDFPDLSKADYTHHFTLNAKDLRRLFDKTQFAISTEETRYYLNGIYFHCLEVDGVQMLRAVATDGHRLAQAQMAAPKGAEGMPGLILPRKTVAEVLRMLDNPTAEIEISLSTLKIRFKLNDMQIISKLIDGTFPDYSRVIPQNNSLVMVVEKSDFMAGVDRVATVSSERGRAVKLALSERRLVLTVTNPDSGTASEEIETDYDASDLEIGFNARYLLDIAGQIDGDTAEFSFADSGAPTLVRDPASPGAIYVLMPMRV